MEALANQMHGLEDEARQSVQGILPSLHTVSFHGSTLSSPSSKVVTASDVLQIKGLPSKEKIAASECKLLDDHDGGFGGGYDSDDEDKFFDAPEISAKDWAEEHSLPAPEQQPSQSFSVGHRRSFSTTSVNDTSSMKCASDSDVKEKLPQISSDRKMSVSLIFWTLLPAKYCFLLCIRFLLAPLPAFMKVHQHQLLLNGEFVSLQNHVTNLACGQS